MAAPRAGRTRKFVPPEGQVRRSQVVSTYGPGAMVDLLDHAVLVSGLDFWKFGGGKGQIHHEEPRLRDLLAERLQALGRPLSLEGAFREPPVGDDKDPTSSRGIPALQIPQWFVCQNPACRALVRADGLEIKGGRYRHHCMWGGPAESVPVRFVAACKRGHLEDFPWLHFVHEGQEKLRCPGPSLRLDEGSTGDFSEIWVRCACGAERALAKALAPDANPLCRGQRPWLGSDGQEECGERLRLLVRTASNAYFPQVVSALSLPRSGRELEEAVRSVWDVLQAANRENLPFLRDIPKVKAALASFPDDRAVLEVVEALRAGRVRPREPLRTAEMRQLMTAPKEQPGDLPSPEETFFARRIEPEGGLPPGFGAVVLAHKLREVRAQVGFTRIEAATPDLQGEFDLEVRSAPLGLVTDWLPATEILGEGVFLALDEEALREWEQRPAVVARTQELLEGYREWAATQSWGTGKPRPFPGGRFYLLHSLAHLLISAISLECGYSASAIRERIYSSAGDEEPMAAILLATGSSGTEGTLGGLVEQGRRLRYHLRHAFDIGSLCSNDPVCAAHSPEDDPAERFLEGAACHGCLFVAECSCERFNRYLDRALVVPALGHPAELAFLGRRP